MELRKYFGLLVFCGLQAVSQNIKSSGADFDFLVPPLRYQAEKDEMECMCDSKRYYLKTNKIFFDSENDLATLISLLNTSK